MSMTDSAVFRNVNTKEKASVAVATIGIGTPRDGVVLDVNMKTMVKELRHEAAGPDSANAL
jgi:hypothetical protein